ncbi:MAG: hypothetical protein PHO92_04845 [Candidatus Peribacteraceae bacterium]|nr:hypothetical protein [Candidatus Peribacteraceae bacterium]
MSLPSLLLGFLIGFFVVNYVIQKSERQHLAARRARRQKTETDTISELHGPDRVEK